jgi:sterol desaturase/sphingolipid hydroxylase (fatty acid hydroxylase superfamily)
VITDFIIDALMGALDAVLSLLPVVLLPVVTVTSYGAQFAGYVAGMSRVVPLADIVVLLGLGVAVFVAFSVTDLGVWIYHQFWGSS